MSTSKFTKLLKDYTSQILLAVIIFLVSLCMYYKNQCITKEMYIDSSDMERILNNSPEIKRTLYSRDAP